MDDSVPVTAKYSFSKQGELLGVRKEMVAYKNAGSKFDSQLNSIDYLYDADKKLLGAKGVVKSTFKENGGSETVMNFFVKALEVRALSEGLKSANRSSMTLVDPARVSVSEAQSRASSGRTFDEAMKDLDQVTAATDGGVFYDIFRSLADQIRVNPAYSEIVAKKILSEKERDEGTKRKLAAMFGALAESGHTEGADTLTKLAGDCGDRYCKTQAMMGINTHSKPSAKNTQDLLSLARSESDKEVAATAIIAAGATGRKIESAPPELGRDLIQFYGDPSKTEIKTSTIAAMGNHGSTDYLPTLKEGLKSSESNVRSAAAYSLRYVRDETVNPTLIE
ncbi:MAG: HEAT repeat domain-containing protein, partial [Proteobacteria bacterium]